MRNASHGAVVGTKGTRATTGTIVDSGTELEEEERTVVGEEEDTRQYVKNSRWVGFRD